LLPAKLWSTRMTDWSAGKICSRFTWVLSISW
jgi:hypothetical protein